MLKFELSNCNVYYFSNFIITHTQQYNIITDTKHIRYNLTDIVVNLLLLPSSSLYVHKSNNCDRHHVVTILGRREGYNNTILERGY